MSDDSSGAEPPQERPVGNDGGKPLLNRVFGTLANQRRRYILYYVREHKQVQTDELAVQIVAWEHDIPRDEVATADTDEVKESLIHAHLPKLADYGFIEYDRRSAAITDTHLPSLLDDTLNLAATIEKPS